MTVHRFRSVQQRQLERALELATRDVQKYFVFPDSAAIVILEPPSLRMAVVRAPVWRRVWTWLRGRFGR